ncbi:hypothetical protein MPSEU_000692700 [Mayamaea pseudoterrestris]|nr:hypothetical protein MPSEU_000692700 [Mayamaea pseudoterrestris]
MIVVRNSKEGQRNGQSSQPNSPAVYMHPPVRATHPGASPGANGIFKEGLGDGSRLSREALGQTLRNDGRFSTDTDRLVGIEPPERSSNYNGQLEQQTRPYTHRTGFTPRPPRPTIWSSSNSHYTRHHRLTPTAPTRWHHPATATPREARRTTQQQLWPDNRASISASSSRRPTFAGHSTSIPNGSRPWEWKSQSASRNGPPPAQYEHHCSRREWSAGKNKSWLTEGHGTSAFPKESIFVRRDAPVNEGNDSSITRVIPQTDKQVHEHETREERIQEDSAKASAKRSNGLDMLGLLCQATLDVGPMQDNPTGCSCPKSKCVALYCDCFKAGRRCDERNCGCVGCKNTLAESGADGARTKAIRSILARNPRAFLMAGVSAAEKRAPPGENACNCIRSHCLKLYCSCFRVARTCTQSCTCVGCSNRDDDSDRKLAVQLALERRSDCFDVRVREPGLGCACKNNRCIRKYCECFRSNLACTGKCTCRQCGNRTSTLLEDV